MNTETAAPPPSPRQPSLLLASVCFLGVTLIIAVGLFGFSVALQILMFLCLLYAGAMAHSLGYNFVQIRDFMGNSLSKGMPAIYIFVL
ncbi:MAG: hypothetical protein ACR2PJ_03735, partial [Pseudomonadales bacterium]